MIRLFRVTVPAGTFVLLITEVVLIASAFVLATYFGVGLDVGTYLLYDGGAMRIGLVVASIVIGLHFNDLYSQLHVSSPINLLRQLCMAIGIAFFSQAFFSYLNAFLRVPIRVMVPGSFLALLAIFVFRMLFSRYALGVMGVEKLLLVGDSPLLEDIGAYIDRHPETGLIVATGSRNGNGSEPSERKTLLDLKALRDTVKYTRPRRIVVGLSEYRNRMPVAELLELRFAGHIIEEAADTYERVIGRICLRELRPSRLIYSGELGPRRESVFYHTLTNVVGAVIGIIIALPLMLLTAIAVRLSSAGPILYRQTRVGLDGVPFTLYKFRSMRADAEKGTGAVWAAKDDPRATPVGRIIRNIRFDELPQLFNVLRGEMSIVGPRPERPEFVKTFIERIPYYAQRHSVRPGITGWAQINYKYGDTLEDTVTKLEYDLYYIKNMSLSLDMFVIFHTVKAMLLSRGAQ
jgi:sugar transferase (PEP-CTERM system associated)